MGSFHFSFPEHRSQVDPWRWSLGSLARGQKPPDPAAPTPPQAKWGVGFERETARFLPFKGSMCLCVPFILCEPLEVPLRFLFVCEALEASLEVLALEVPVCV